MCEKKNRMGLGAISDSAVNADRFLDTLPSSELIVKTDNGHTFVLGAMRRGRSPFRAFAENVINLVVQADVALGNKIDRVSARNHLKNIEPLLSQYGKFILAKSAPEGWDKLYFQILDNLDPKTLPFSLKDRNPECIALLKYCESTEFYDPLLDSLLRVFEYDRSYFDKIVSSLILDEV